jgi:hypothetical protein
VTVIYSTVPSRFCDDTGTPPPVNNWATCPHRSPPVGEINARKAGCGCASSTAEVYECDVFGEVVLLHSPARCVEAVSAVYPTYAGRTCRGCPIPSKPAPTT